MHVRMYDGSSFYLTWMDGLISRAGVHPPEQRALHMLWSPPPSYDYASSASSSSAANALLLSPVWHVRHPRTLPYDKWVSLAGTPAPRCPCMPLRPPASPGTVRCTSSAAWTTWATPSCAPRAAATSPLMIPLKASTAFGSYLVRVYGDGSPCTATPGTSPPPTCSTTLPSTCCTGPPTRSPRTRASKRS